MIVSLFRDSDMGFVYLVDILRDRCRERERERKSLINPEETVAVEHFERRSERTCSNLDAVFKTKCWKKRWKKEGGRAEVIWRQQMLMAAANNEILKELRVCQQCRSSIQTYGSSKHLNIFLCTHFHYGIFVVVLFCSTRRIKTHFEK